MESKRQTGIYLKECRLKSGLSQSDISSRLGYKSPQFVSNIERGIADPPPRVIKSWCKIIGASSLHVAGLLVSDYVADLEKRLGVKL